MKAERLGIVMLYGSLVIFLSLFVCFSPYVFLSVTISFILFSLFFGTFALVHHQPTHKTHSYTQTLSHLVALVYYVHVSIVGRCD